MKNLVYKTILVTLAMCMLFNGISVSGAILAQTADAQAEEELENMPTEEAEEAEETDRSPFMAVTDHDRTNEELQVYEKSQTVVDGYKITMTAEEAEHLYVSGKAESKMAFRYGTFTFRVNRMEGTGLFPAIWLLPLYDSRYPEIDIYEMVGDAPNEIYCVLHTNINGRKGRNFRKYEFPEDEIPETYTVSLVWEEDKLEWYVNGELEHTITENVPDMPMFLITNLAVGGIWPGWPTKNTEFPAKFEVDVLEFEPKEIFIR